MKGQVASRKGVSVAEYLAAERTSDQKHEYFRGEIFAMAGGSREHNLIATNIAGELRGALREQPCEVYSSDMRVKVEATGLHTYPDVSVVCGEPKFEEDKRDTLLNPIVIFEILSDTTEAYDRGKKFENYRAIPLFSEYVLASQNEVLVEHFVRQSDGGWVMRELRSGESITLTSIGCTLPLDEAYLKVFPA